MTKVLIIGATGYIGLALADSLVHSGLYTVYGLARSEEKAKLLSQHEIIPVLGSISDSGAYLKLIEDELINVVVDTSGAFQESMNILKHLKELGSKRLKQAAEIGIRTQKLGFIYTSGTWVHGNSHEKAEDTSPVGVSIAKNPPAKIVAWRTELEQDVLKASDVLDTMIVRPALVYGRAAAMWTMILKPILDGAKSGAASVDVGIEPDSRPALVHIDDLASGLRAAIEKLFLISGTGVYPIFDLGTSAESMRSIVDEAALVLGYKGEVKLVGSDDLMMQAMGTSGNISGARARQILGWQPTRAGFAREMRLYLNAWRASL